MRESFRKKIIVLDEASLTSTQQIQNLITLSSKMNFKVILLGDTKQLGRIEAGRPFYYLQEHGMNTALVNNIMRQKNEELLKSVYKSEESVDKESLKAVELIKNSLELIGKNNIIDLYTKEKSITNTELGEAVYEKWLEHYNANQEALVVVPSNPLRKEVNSHIRTHYIQGSSIPHEILINKDLRKIEMKEFESYDIGNVLVFYQSHTNHNIEKQDYWEVIGREDRKNKEDKNDLGTVTIRKDEKTLKLPIKDIANSVEILQIDVIPIAVNEKIKWTRNSKTLDFIVNGSNATIKEIKKNKVQIELANGQIKTFKLTDQDLQHIDHSYSSTVYGAQGKTVDYVIGAVRAKEAFLKLSTQRSFYVTISRARHNATLITDNYKNLHRSLSNKPGAKTSAIEQQTEHKFKDSNKHFNNNRREVFINRNLDETKASVEQTIITVPKKIDYDKKYQEFINSPSLIKTTACSIFGEVNQKFSKADNLRFGNKGSISVNLRSGQWYDFSSGDGGNLFKSYKSNNLILEKPVEIKVIENKPSAFPATDKIKNVIKLLDKTIPLNQKELGQKYLQEQRCIDLSQINLSDDIRFSEYIWSSEDKRSHSGIVSFARSADGKIKAAQAIYLDPKTANKNKKLEINKRSLGVLKGAHVELTNNKNANNIFIAEGIETALSIAAAYPSDRVICSLGISNIRNIELREQQNIIICADNDGDNSHTNLAIEKAAYALKANGNVIITRPQKAGHDFNDVLKEGGVKAIQDHINPILQKPKLEYQSQFKQLHETIKTNKESEQDLQKTACFEVYKDRKNALSLWSKLVQEKGLKTATSEVTNKPELLGKLKGIDILTFRTAARTKALSELQNNIKNLNQIHHHQELIKLTQKQLSELKADFTKRYLADIGKFKTKTQDIDSLQQKLERIVAIALNNIYQINDFESVKTATQKTAAAIINHRNRYQQEATTHGKQKFLLKSCFEESRRSEVAKALVKSDPTLSQDHLLFEQKLTRLLSIDSKNADKQSPYYEPKPVTEALSELHNNDRKITALTAEHIKKGMSLTQANFIATEMIKHEEQYETHMSNHQLEHLKTIGDYVDHNFDLLEKSGFNKQEARITYNEGANLLLHYNAKVQNSNSITKSEVISTQKMSKQYIERPQNKQITQTFAKPISTKTNGIGVEI